MLTDKQLAQLQLSVYGVLPVEWDYYQDGTGSGDVVYGVKIIDGVSVVVLRGSVTLHDWIRDVMAFTLPFAHDALGPVHPGFAAGMATAWQDIQAHTSGPRIFVGHSLGAARAAILTGLAILDHQPPLARIVWGEPKPGFSPLAALISSVPGRSYRNKDARHHDLITDAPLSFPPLEYVRCGHVIDICQPPPPGLCANFGAFSHHHMDLYAAATPDTPSI